jgi:hypothetical protein
MMISIRPVCSHSVSPQQAAHAAKKTSQSSHCPHKPQQYNGQVPGKKPEYDLPSDVSQPGYQKPPGVFNSYPTEGKHRYFPVR